MADVKQLRMFCVNVKDMEQAYIGEIDGFLRERAGNCAGK